MPLETRRLGYRPRHRPDAFVITQASKEMTNFKAVNAALHTFVTATCLKVKVVVGADDPKDSILKITGT
jgi:spore maturation protein SpmA